MPLELMYITNNPEIALIAEKAGVHRIWIDLETLGKEERQKGMNTVKSLHSIHDIEVIKPLLTKAKMQVRINPWNETSVDEIEKVITAGAELIMLPLWKTPDEVENFIKTVNGRATTVLLLETKEAEKCLDDVLKIDGVDEIHIGLNDLHLSYGLTFMFELLANGTVDRICEKVNKAGKKFGFGGISHLGDGMIPAEMIITEHYRIGSTRAILSRGFCNLDSPDVESAFIKNMNDFREHEKKVLMFSKEEIEMNRNELIKKVDFVVEAKKNG